MPLTVLQEKEGKRLNDSEDVVRLVLDFFNIFTLIFSLKYNWMDFR